MKHIKCILILATFILLVFSSALHSTESTTINCYRVDSTNYIYLGDIQIIHLINAGATCNSVYNDCDERCVGCYINAESLEICIDKNGQQFQKP
jgi:hypothetical protein